MDNIVQLRLPTFSITRNTDLYNSFYCVLPNRYHTSRRPIHEGIVSTARHTDPLSTIVDQTALYAMPTGDFPLLNTCPIVHKRCATFDIPLVQTISRFLINRINRSYHINTFSLLEYII